MPTSMKPVPTRYWSSAAGNEYLTAPDFYIQALELSKYIRALPGFLEEESGGLLRAMVQNHDLHIRWVSESYARGLEKIKPATAA
jgi:hypothetical protein